MIGYVCPFRSSTTGEVRDIVVELSLDEVKDVLRHGPVYGPLARGYAWHRAARIAPDGFVPVFDQDQLVQ
jgi:hypothetical protein